VAANVQQVSVTSSQELDSAITSYIAQGFTVQNRTADSATLFKKKEFNILWAVIGFFLCVLPLLVYCIVYATQNDQMVVIKIVAVSSSFDAATNVTWSDDRQWWWDGSRWRDTHVELPPDAMVSEDGHSWWDGVDWRPVPAAGDAAETEALAPPPEPPAESSIGSSAAVEAPAAAESPAAADPPAAQDA
jgi:hypothetical protein